MRLIPGTTKSKTDHAKEQLTRQIESVERKIDSLVYELYGLKNDEIAVVEAAK